MKATNGNFNLQTQKISGNSKVDFLVDQTLELNPKGDWKWEYLTFSTSNEKGIDAYFPILRDMLSKEEAMDPETAQENLYQTAVQIFRFTKALLYRNIQ